MRDRARALPAEAVGHLLTMLAMSRPEEVYAGVGVVREHCDPASLTEFGWELFELWRQEDGTPGEDWALHQLGWLGDDETVRRLSPLIRSWPGENLHARAAAGLDVLAAIGTETALAHLSGIAERVRYKGLRERARRRIEDVADRLELTPEQLADRLVPSLGLDAAGGMVLDYGPRRFTVVLDERLAPQVIDENGRRLKNLPKPGAKDDPGLAPEAYRRFAAFRKDLRTVAADQISRFEAAMLARRRWSRREFGDLVVAHPLLWHIARRLVWLAEDAGRTTAFRIAEDRTFADAADDAVTLPDEARIRIAHPLDLGDSLGAWSALFADYQIAQPFPQLGRAVHTLTDAERGSSALTRYENITVPTGKVVGLEGRGWRRPNPEIAGWQPCVYREAGENRYVVLDLEPGISLGNLAARPIQILGPVRLADHSAIYWREGTSRYTFGELDPLTVSEILADLAEPAASAD